MADHSKRALFIKPKHLGDTVVLTGAISLLPSEWKVDVYVLEESASLIRLCPRVENIYFSHRSAGYLTRLFGTISTFIQIRLRNYDLVASFSDQPKSAIIARISGAAIRVAFKSRRRGLWWHRSFTRLTEPPAGHAALRDAELIRNSSIKVLTSLTPRYLLATSSTYRLDSKYIVINPCARWKFKQLPIKVWQDLLPRLALYDFEIVLTGAGSRDAAYIKDIAQFGVSFCTQLVDRSMNDLYAIVQSARYVITVDSLMVHLASAARVPTLAIFGPTKEFEWGPWETKYRVVSQTVRYPCRPCDRDGCGGSKISDCLETMSASLILGEFEMLVADSRNS
jgi:heptosyltransferase-3